MNAFPFFIKVIILVSLCFIMFKSINCTMMNKAVHCNEKDMSTLLNFKQGVIDPTGMLSSWSTQHDCCEWFGVHCDNITGNSRVTELNLPCHHSIPSAYSDIDDKSKCLTGELNLSLLQLEFLSYLNLSNNDFKSIIQYNHKCNNSKVTSPPPLSIDDECVIKYSSKLHYLDLSYNDDIVINNLHWIYNLSSLEYLNLNGINLHKEIDWLLSMAKLPSLIELHMSRCQLQYIYPYLQYVNFTSLKHLTLSFNDIGSVLPSWLFNLSSGISHINLAENNIHGQLPKTLPNSLQSIKLLGLTGNKIDGPIPNWFGQLQHLNHLYLFDNAFTGPIPQSLGNLSSLISLGLSANLLNGSLSINLGKLVNLELLEVEENLLTGIVSQKNFLSLSNLKYLYLSSPDLTFDFDPEWIPPFQLKELCLGYVSPKLPSWLFTQSSLEELIIIHSSLSLELHDMLSNFSQLEFLTIQDNNIDGDMSNVLITSKVTWLIDNIWRGGLPRISPNVTILSLHNNNLSGLISPFLCPKMKEKYNLEYLDISYNHLSGELPDCWMNWKSLLHLELEHNNLTGEIPQSMGMLSNLISLNLNKNRLFGKVPLSFKNCQNLWVLNLGANKFSGRIPYWAGRKSIKALQLRSNEFSGNIPPQICQLNSLKMLDFANNRLSGPIPNCLHNITSLISDYASFDEFFIRINVLNGTKSFAFNLMLLIKGNELYYQELIYVVDFSNNSLSGTMPSEIYSLTRLQSLNLSHNQLVGEIPQEIGNLKNLESIDLSRNRLSGEIPQSMSGLSYLGVLNLSFNNFEGKIPSGTQLQGFANLSYIGNPNLCGPPLTKSCPQVEKSNNSNSRREDDESEVHWWSWFYMGMGIGFATGFWAVLGAIFFNRVCRHAYFGFLERLYVIMLIKINHIRS